MTRNRVRDTVREFLSNLILDRVDESIEKTNNLLNPLVEDGSIDGFDTMYDDTDRSFAIDVYYIDGLCDTFTIQPGVTIQEKLS
mgnify:FL=1